MIDREVKAIKNEIRRKVERDAMVNWQRNRERDAALMQGVQARQTFGEFQQQTGAPGFLMDRYVQLQQASGIVPGSGKPDPIGESIKRALTE